MPYLQVALQAAADLRPEGDVPALVELRLRDEQQLTVELKIAPTQSPGLPVAQSQGNQERQHGHAGLGTAAAHVVVGQLLGRRENGNELLSGEDIRFEGGTWQTVGAGQQERHGVARHHGQAAKVLEEAANETDFMDAKASTARQRTLPLFDQCGRDGLRGDYGLSMQKAVEGLQGALLRSVVFPQRLLQVDVG